MQRPVPVLTEPGWALAMPVVQIPPNKAISARFLVSNPAVMIGVPPCRYGCSLAYFQPEKDRFNFLMERLKRARDEKSHIHFRSKRKAWISVRRNDSGATAPEGIRQALALATVRGGRYRRAACLRSGAGPRWNERGVRRALSQASNLQEAAVEAASRLSALSLPPPPVGMRPAPVCVALLVPADQNAKTNAGFSVTLLAKLMVTDHLGFHSVLSMGW